MLPPTLGGVTGGGHSAPCRANAGDPRRGLCTGCWPPSWLSAGCFGFYCGLRPAVSQVKRLFRVRCNPAHRVGQKLLHFPPRLGDPTPQFKSIDSSVLSFLHSPTLTPIHIWGFPGGPVVKNLPCNAGDTGLSPGPGRSHRGVREIWRSHQGCQVPFHTSRRNMGLPWRRYS